MKNYFELVLKLFFALSIFPFLLAEKLQEKFEVRIDPQVVDTIYTQPLVAGKIQNKEIDEASGLAASGVHPDLLYTHNDSGGDPYIYLIGFKGEDKGRIKLKGTTNRDWEDIAVGPGPDEGISYVYVGEIGDNQGSYSDISILRFPEPNHLGDGQLEVEPEVIRLTYPDGPRDAETLMIDPWNGDLFILTKRDSSNTLYMATAADLKPESSPVPLKKLGKLPITMSVAGDISRDGKRILIKNYWVIYHWYREMDESIVAALSKNPVLLPYKPEPQGEAIAFKPDGSGYFTLSEKKMRIEPVLYEYHRIP